jgi:hypothetical protein
MPDLIGRFFGGPPLYVVARLVMLSILVGVVLSALGLDPLDVIRSLRRLALAVWDMGFDVVRWLWGYFLLGAALVIPLWALSRLLRTRPRN